MEHSDQQAAHKYFSASSFNECWNYLEKDSLSVDENEELIRLAYNSLWYWTQRDDIQDKNLSVAYWLMGRVFCVTENLEKSSYYGNKNLTLCKEKELSPFYTGYAYETLVNIAVLKKEFSLSKKWLAKAMENLQKIEDKEEKEYLSDDLGKLELQIP